MRKYAKTIVGFNLIELMIVLAIVAILSAIALPGFMRFVAKAKRTEAYVTLRALYAAEKAHWIEYGTYSPFLTGPEGIGWRPEGTLNYTYGFSGAEGKNHFMGKLQTPATALHMAKASANEFLIVAAGDIDGDGEHDILTINHQGLITVIKDDLA